MENLLWLLAGIGLIAAGLPLMAQKVPPNHWYGFRVPKTLRDADIWYKANRVAGRDLFLLGAALLLSVLLTALLSLVWPSALLSQLNFTVFTIGMTATVIHSFWVLSKL